MATPRRLLGLTRLMRAASYCTMLLSRTAAPLRIPPAAAAATSAAAAATAAPRRAAHAPPLLSAPESASDGLTSATMRFLDGSPDPFHAVANLVAKLTAAGFVQIHEADAWTGTIKRGGRYFFVRNRSCLVAFVVGGSYAPGGGFKIIGSHTDSPNLKVKPRSKLKPAAGLTQVDVETYGGGLWHTWFDRDLSVSGRVVVRDQDGRLQQRLVKIDAPLLRVPTLCIHLQTAQEREAFAYNKEDHLQPILAAAATQALNGDAAQATTSPTPTGDADADASADTDGAGGGGDAGAGAGEASEGEEELGEWSAHQEPMLLSAIAAQLGIETDQIADFELNLYDTQAAAVCGARGEFLNSARLDNLVSCFLATEALLAHCAGDGDSDGDGEGKGMGAAAGDTDVSLIALFDHEEVGSGSAVGAGSPIMIDSVRRISAALAGGAAGVVPDDLMAASLAKSFVFSLDMAHAVHPNYQQKHEVAHGPRLNAGLVIKSNANQRYASNPVTAFVVRELARRASLPPPQEFVVRNDCPCGSTIGPIISAATGIRAVDVGLPQLSMHSVREMMGVDDLDTGLAMFTAFFKDFRDLDNQLGK